jgi:hypothetical protein
MSPRGSGRRVLLDDPYLREDGTEMEFRLTYAGPLTAWKDDGVERQKARAPEKHRLRQAFHEQLKALWHHHPNLKQFLVPWRPGDKPGIEAIANNWDEFGFRFVPLVRGKNVFLCKLEILMLRPGELGDVFVKQTGDIDNRLKTIFDALKKPQSREELGGATPQADEDPFFVLLEDDGLITHVAVETDVMLQPVTGDINDVRLLISVTVRPYNVNMDTLDYS